jgi:glycogen debranching enzyme
VLKVGGDFYILASSVAGRRETRAIVSGEGFAVLDVSGDIVGSPIETLGFFYSDTRYLSSFEFRISGKAPAFLNSYLRDDQAELIVNLTNPDLTEGPETVILPRDSVQIERRCVIFGNALFQHNLIRNFASEHIQLKLEFLVNADFADLFEVRGVRRRKRGDMLEPTAADGQVQFHYKGLDDVERSSSVFFSPRPHNLTVNCATYQLELEPNAVVVIECRISADAGNGSRIKAVKPLRFDEALKARSDELAELRNEWTKIRASNEPFDLLLNRSAAALNSLISNRTDSTFIMAGIPWFATLFGRDSILTAMAMLPYYPAIAKRTLRTLGQFQGSRIDDARDEQPGKIVHEIRMGEMAATSEIPFGRYYGSVDATPLFLWLLGEYVAIAGDLSLANELWPNVERALEWIGKYGDSDGDGYVEYRRETPRGLANQGWKDSFDAISHSNGELARAPIALVEVQGYVYAAYVTLAEVSAKLGRDSTAMKLTDKAEALKQNFLRDFWSPDDGLLALALDADKRPCKVMTSNSAHCLATGLFDGEPAAKLMGRLMDDEMFCGWGIRTLSTAERRYNPMSYHNGSVWPHDNGIAAMGLGRVGDREAVTKLISGLVQAAESLGTGSLPELFCGFAQEPRIGPVPYPVACHPQAWAAASVFMILTAMLGLRINGFEQKVSFDSPKMPQWLDTLQIDSLTVGKGSVSLLIKRTLLAATIEILDKRGDVTVEILK